MENPTLQLNSTQERYKQVLEHVVSYVESPYDLSLNITNGHYLIDILHYVYDGGDLDRVKESIEGLLNAK